MAKAMSVEDARDDAEAGEEAGSGAFARAKAAVSTHIGLGFDAAIGALQRRRAKFLPAPEAGESPATEEEAPPPSKMRRFMRNLAIGALVLMIGAMTGGWLAFNVFAQKIERQNQLIADQAEEAADYRKDADRAERLRDDAKAQLRDVEHELAQVKKDYEDAKSRLAEMEGRTLMYGNANSSAPRPARSPYTTPSRGAAPRGQSGECELSSAQDLSRCLSHSK